MIPQYNIYLCTVRDVQDWQLLEHTNADWTALQVRLMKHFVKQASQQAATYLGWLPVPYQTAHSFDYAPGPLTPDARTLILDAPLLTPTTITNGNGDTIGSSSYVLKNANRYPKRYIELQNGTVFVPATNGTTAQVITVAGEFGYVPHYGRHWKVTGVTVPVGGLTDSTETLTLADTSAFDIGDYLRINEETLAVENKTDTVLTLERGALGTTAAAHDAGDSILRFVQLEDIRTAVAEWAAYLYKTRDRLGESVQVYDRQTRIVNQLSPLVHQALARHRRWEIASL